MEILQVDTQNPSTRQLTHLTCEISESKMVKCSNSQWFRELWSSFWHPCKLHCFLHFVLCLRPWSKSKCTLSPHLLTAYNLSLRWTSLCFVFMKEHQSWIHLNTSASPWNGVRCTPLSQGQWSRPTHATNPNSWFDLTGFLRSDGRPEQCARKSQNSRLCHFRIIVEHNYHPHLHTRPIKPAVHEQVSHVWQLYNVPKTHHLFTLKIMKKLIKHCCLAITRLFHLHTWMINHWFPMYDLLQKTPIDQDFKHHQALVMNYWPSQRNWLFIQETEVLLELHQEAPIVNTHPNHAKSAHIQMQGIWRSVCYTQSIGNANANFLLSSLALIVQSPHHTWTKVWWCF